MQSPIAIPRHLLSKSTFMYGCQCIKRLWLHKNMAQERDEMSQAQTAVFARGTEVGALARDIFPGGVDTSPVDAFHYQQSVEDTRNYIAKGQTIIYEAAFQFEGVLAALDILVQQNGKWYGYEVKSSTSVKVPFLQDAALQYYVITNAGIALEDIYIVHINNEYVRKGQLDLEQLFSRKSIKEEVLELQSFISTKVGELKEIIRLEEMPEIGIGDHCAKPYACDFQSFCWNDYVEENPKQFKENIDKKAIAAFLSQLKYPLYFLDFETYNVPVPEYDGHWPYRQVPFQYSIHKQMSQDSPVEHTYYLAPINCDPCPELVEKLIKDLGNEGSVLVYFKPFENTRFNELKDDYPQFAKAIENIQERIVDLMTPFKKKHYSLPAMQGKYSIKNVLPALIPEMSYEGLAIGNGTDASAAYLNLRFETDSEKVQATRKALLDYCELDTLAMVRILEKLKQL